MNSGPLVSVVVPSYNAGAFICDAIASVIGQSWRNLEIIVVDDGSTDNTAGKVKAISDTRIQYHYQENASQAVARNKGINLSQGEYVAFLDADDIWIPGKLEKQMKLFENPNTGLVYSRSEYLDPNCKRERAYNLYRGNVLKELLFNNFIPCSSVVLKKSIVGPEKLFRTGRKGVEDWDLWLRLSMVNEFDYVDEPLLKYRKHPQSVSHDRELMMKSVEATVTEIGKEIIGTLPASEAEECLDLLNTTFAKEYMTYAHWLLYKGRLTEADNALLRSMRLDSRSFYIIKELLKFKIKRMKKSFEALLHKAPDEK